MTNGAEIQKRNNDAIAGMGFEPTNLTQMITFADMLGKSGLVPAAIRGKPQDILVVLMTGHEFGLSPMASLRLVSAVDGKAIIGGEAYLAVVQASPECEFFDMVESTPKKATFKAKKRGSDTVHTLTWTIEQAATAGLLGKDNWKRYPDAMLRWRCVSALAKLVFASRFAGVYTEDEKEEIVASGSTSDGTAQRVDTVDALADRARAERAKDASHPGAGSVRTVDVVADNPKRKSEKEKQLDAEAAAAARVADDPASIVNEPTPEDVAALAKKLQAAGAPFDEANLRNRAYFDEQTSKLAQYVKAATGTVSASDVGRAEKAGPAPVDPGPVMVFGPDAVKGKPIASLDGPTLHEMVILGETKIGQLKDDVKSTKEQKAAKVRACIEAIKAEQKKRETAAVEDPPEPGGSDFEIE